MPIKDRCPNCRALFAAPDETLGRTGRCKRCGVQFPIRREGGSAAETPTTIDRYEVRELLGRGTFGAVYRAFDPRLEREVALKVLRSEMTSSPESVQRFLREAKAAAKLTHPHIVPVHDAGRAGDVYFIAAAFIKGKTLSTAIRRGGVNQRWAAVLGAQLASALGYAHRQGVLHRDVKPANILLDEEGSLHLTDFGLAGWTHEEATRLTREGALMGTPAYMAPEQASGELARVGPPSDLYSAGVVLYELLTGLPPFDGHAAALVYKLVHVAVPPPSRLRPSLDPRLEAVCLKALAKEPERRYRSGEEMAAALQAAALPTAPATLQPARIEATTEYRPDPASVGVDLQPATNAVTESDVSQIATPGPAGPAAKVAPPLRPRGRSRRRWAMGGVAAAVMLAGLACVAVAWAWYHRPAVGASVPSGEVDVKPHGAVTPAGKDGVVTNVEAKSPPTAVARPQATVVQGEVVGVDPDKLTVNVDGTERTFKVPAAAKVLFGSKQGRLEDVQKGSIVAVTSKDDIVLTVDTILYPPAAQAGPDVGRFVRVEDDILVLMDDRGRELRVPVTADTKVLIDGAAGKPADVRKESIVAFTRGDGHIASVEAKTLPKPSPAAAPFEAAEAKRVQQAWADYLGVPVVREVNLGGGVTMTLVLIPPGSFLMGSPDSDEDANADERPRRKVTITAPYYLGTCPVTQEQYMRLTGDYNPSWFSEGGEGKELVKGVKTGKLPVEHVSWFEAAQFCKALNQADAKRPPGWRFALPTEAQWEHACRAGTTTAYFFGDDTRDLARFAWYTDNSGRRTHDVGTAMPNAWGLYDMAGNVSQWCDDEFGPYPYNQFTDPVNVGDGSGTRVLRGGSCFDFPKNNRSAHRFRNDPKSRYADLGFRVALRPD